MVHPHYPGIGGATTNYAHALSKHVLQPTRTITTNPQIAIIYALTMKPMILLYLLLDLGRHKLGKFSKLSKKESNV
jgi:hypothetical protein